MTSEKQIQANKRNAQKSTGPKTSEGKAAVRHNALTHGLLSQDVLVPGEDEAAFTELGERLRDELQPVGELENMFVDRIIATQWRLRRLGRVEAGIFAWEHYNELIERAVKEARGQNRNYRRETLLEHVGSNTLHIEDREKTKESIRRINELEAMQDAQANTLGRTFVRDADEANAFSKLSRYETALAGSLYKALHELQRLQAARRAEGNVSPPVAVDVEVSGVSDEDL